MKTHYNLVYCLLALGLFFFDQIAASDLLLRDNLERARPGDFLVTSQNKNYTVLSIRGRNGQQLYIEEITVPLARIGALPFSWKTWVEGNAPGHTCWLLYTIDLPTGMMQQTYSYTRGESVTIPQSQNFFSTLFNLKFNKVAEVDRKKVGPAPSTDSRDRRRIWQPDLVVDGKVMKGVSFDAWKARWPNDGTELGNKIVEIYVPSEGNKYPSYFPYFLQISGHIGNAKIRIVDSGSGLMSPKT